MASAAQALPAWPAYWSAAQQHLQNDAPLAAIMAAHPTGCLQSRGDAFHTLMRSIVGQQISVKAADAVWARLHARVQPFTPATLLACAPEDLRAVGLSSRKVGYAQGIAAGFVNGTLHPAKWAEMDDEAVIAELVRLPGIGRWTAEMFLMFHLLRPNLLPVDDIGLLKAYEKHYLLPAASAAAPPTRAQVVAALKAHAAAHWVPYCSVATWYLWRSLDPVEVSY